MPLLTLKEAREDRGILQIASLSPTSQDFTDLINQACRKALRRGDWTGTVIPIHTCVHQGCIVWPRYVGHVRKMNLCDRAPVPINNLWYSFLDHVEHECWFPWIGGRWNDLQSRMDAKGYTSVFRDILGEDRKVRAYYQLAVDIGKTIRIFGTDSGNQPLRTNNNDGTWSDGYEMILGNPYVQTVPDVRTIDRVTKDETQGNITLYAYNTVSTKLEALATYEPSETNPTFEKYGLSLPVCTSGSCTTTQSIVALVKLKFLPAKYPNDLVYLQNLDALKLFIQSIKSEEAGDRASARGYEEDAIREVNLDLHNRDMEDQITVAIEPFSGQDMSSHSVY